MTKFQKQTNKWYRDVETNEEIFYHPSDPFIFDFINTVRNYYKNHPDELKANDIIIKSK